MRAIPLSHHPVTHDENVSSLYEVEGALLTMSSNTINTCVQHIDQRLSSRQALSTPLSTDLFAGGHFDHLFQLHVHVAQRVLRKLSIT